MAVVTMASQFSDDGKYFAYLSTESKLQIWNALSGTFEQEYTPNFHLTSPCTCFRFIRIGTNFNKVGTPRNKKVKQRESEEHLWYVVLGTNSGLLVAYSIGDARVDFQINTETSQSISCVSWDNESLVYSGAECNILCLDIKGRKVRSKWKSGNDKITSILVLPQNRLLTASRMIKLWDTKTQEVLTTFTGHASEVTILQFVSPRRNGDCYFISGSKSDRLLSCWILNENDTSKNAVANYLMEDIACNVSIVIGQDCAVNMAAVTRSGVVHVYQHVLNGKCSKPLKPKTTIQVASDVGGENTIVTPVPIHAALYQNDLTIMLCYGSSAFTFENVTINSYEKVQCLVRNNRKTKASQKEEASKTRTPLTGNHVQYLTPFVGHTPSAGSSSSKRKGQLEVPMEKRLDNLTLSNLNGEVQTPRGDNVAQLLLQGLHSKDKSILKEVLTKRNETVIKNTIKRLPLPVIAPLVHELAGYIQSKTLMTHIGTLWLKNLLQIHAGLLLSNPELLALLAPILSSIENRLALHTPLTKLKGRLDLLISQVNVSAVQDEEHEALLVYNDKDTNESEAMDDLDVQGRSDSETEWMEEASEEDKAESDSEIQSAYELSD